MALKKPFDVLRPEYEALLARAEVAPSREKEVARVVTENLFPNKSLYQKVQAKTGVPAAFVMAIAMREMSGNVTRYIGNGQPLSRVTTIVPKGRGPFTGPDAFVRGAMDAFAIDGLDKVNDWTMARACYESETYNGWGYRNASINIPSPYLWGATTVQKRGKYIRDGIFDRSVMDTQIGTVAIMEEIFKLDPDLAFAEPVKKEEKAPETGDKSKPAPKQEPIKLAPAPVGVGGGVNVFLMQALLNKEKVAGTPIRVDGIFGRETTRAVKAYQHKHGLIVDGLVGPQTLKKMGFIK